MAATGAAHTGGSATAVVAAGDAARPGGSPIPAIAAAEAGRPGGILSAIAARAERWLLEPAAPRPRATEPEPRARAVIAVVALGARCGTTTIARALAIELARRDPGGAAFVTSRASGSRGAVPALATAAARRLARAFAAEVATAAGRLCMLDRDDPAVRELAASRPAPLVLDVGHGQPPEAALALADTVVLVATPDVEPALADVVGASLSRDGRTPPTVLNRAVDLEGWSGRDALIVPEARLGARLALAGRDPTPALARPIAYLADALVGEEET
jgi:DNA polymerase-3 subunit gamma/tau